MLNIKVEKLLENIPEVQDVNERLKDTATKVETIGDRLKSQSVLVKHSQRTIELADRFRTISSYFDKIEELKDFIRAYQDAEDDIVTRLKVSYSDITLEKVDIAEAMKAIDMIKLKFK